MNSSRIHLKLGFLDKYPEDRKEICVTMEVDDRTMILIGTYHRDKQVILNGAIGIFQIHPNDNMDICFRFKRLILQQ